MGALELLWEYRAPFALGLATTVWLLVIAMIAGTFSGAALAIVSRADPTRLARSALDALAFAGAAVPALIILFWVHYPGQALLGIRASGFATAAITLSLLNALAVYRMLMDAADEFPRQFLLAAKVAGLGPRTTLYRIYAPMIARSVVPRWIDQQVFILHCTLLASFISVEETFRTAQRINSTIYQPVLIYTSVAILFLIVAGAALHISGRLRARLSRDWSER